MKDFRIIPEFRILRQQIIVAFFFIYYNLHKDN